METIEDQSPLETMQKSEPVMVSPSGKKPKKIGLILLLVIGLSLLAFGVFWVVNSGFLEKGKQVSAPLPTPVMTASPTPLPDDYDEGTEKLEEMSDSDEVGDIVSDLENTDLSNLDKELEEIEKEF